MLPLSNPSYEPSVWKQQKVENDYLISDGLNKYSVPFELNARMKKLGMKPLMDERIKINEPEQTEGSVYHTMFADYPDLVDVN